MRPWLDRASYCDIVHGSFLGSVFPSVFCLLLSFTSSPHPLLPEPLAFFPGEEQWLSPSFYALLQNLFCFKLIQRLSWHLTCCANVSWKAGTLCWANKNRMHRFLSPFRPVFNLTLYTHRIFTVTALNFIVFCFLSRFGRGMKLE